MLRLYGFIGVLLMGLLGAHTTEAAALYFDPGLASLGRGDTEIISVRLDTDEAQEECINAIEGVIELTGPIQAVDISLGESILSLWVEEPTIAKDGRQISFAGGVPNGYCGRIVGDPRLTNTLFSLVVQANPIAPADGKTVEATIAFIEPTQVYLNDGFGTTVTPNVTPSIVTVLPTLSTATSNAWQAAVSADQIKPEEFSIQLAQDPLIANGRYYITFNTTDKQTGVDRYEIIEEPLAQFGSFSWGRANAPWIEIRSPYVLKDQSLNSVIRVKAIDKAGNEYIATLIPDEDLRSVPVTRVLVLVSFGAVLLISSIFIFVYSSRRRQNRMLAELDQEFYATEDSSLTTSTDTDHSVQPELEESNQPPQSYDQR